MTNLPKAMREALAKGFFIGLPKLVARTPAPDGTEKFLFELSDGARVEAAQQQHGKCDEGSAARERVLNSRPHGDAEQQQVDEHGISNDCRAEV